LQEFVDELSRLPLAYQPGTRWHYSAAINVIARLIEVISGQALQHFLSQRLFAPLGMTDTGFSVPAGKRGRLATMVGHPDIIDHTLGQIGRISV
jgi:CubicO group peptidase (beta-lactamase class C family)